LHWGSEGCGNIIVGGWIFIIVWVKHFEAIFVIKILIGEISLIGIVARVLLLALLLLLLALLLFLFTVMNPSLSVGVGLGLGVDPLLIWGVTVLKPLEGLLKIDFLDTGILTLKVTALA